MSRHQNHINREVRAALRRNLSLPRRVFYPPPLPTAIQNYFARYKDGWVRIACRARPSREFVEKCGRQADAILEARRDDLLRARRSVGAIYGAPRESASIMVKSMISALTAFLASVPRFVVRPPVKRVVISGPY